MRYAIAGGIHVRKCAVLVHLDSFDVSVSVLGTCSGHPPQVVIAWMDEARPEDIGCCGREEKKGSTCASSPADGQAWGVAAVPRDAAVALGR